MHSEGYSTQFVCACVCVSVTLLTATPLTYRDKVRYESNANALLKVLFVDFAKNTLFKRYGVICSPQRTLTVSTASRIYQKTGDYW